MSLIIKIQGKRTLLLEDAGGDRLNIELYGAFQGLRPGDAAYLSGILDCWAEKGCLPEGEVELG